LPNLKVEAELNVGFFNLKASKDSGGGNPARTVHEVCDALRQLTKGLGECVVVVDEFDQLSDKQDKKYFADLINQISDRQVPSRLMLTGIGRSLEELIGVHPSTERYLTAVVFRAAGAVGLEWDRNHWIRIGQISDGFPYYVHLIGEQVLWTAFD